MGTESRSPAAETTEVDRPAARPTSDHAPRVHAASSQGERSVWLPVARALGAIALLVSGGVHYQQYAVAHFSAIPTIGPLFLANSIAATILGLTLLVPIRSTASRGRLILDSSAAAAGMGVAVGALAALLISEQTPLFGFMEQGYRVEIIVAIAAESVAIAALGVVLVRAGRRVRAGRAAAVGRGDEMRPAGTRPATGRS